MMQINQDTYKEGKLYFGMRGSPQRDKVYAHRNDIFMEVLLQDFPEYYLLLQGDRRKVSKYMQRMAASIKFKYMYKLASGLSYDSLETVGYNEFGILIQRFERFLQKHTTVGEELQKTFR